MTVIASVTIDEIRHQGTIVDRRIQLLLVCGCRTDLSLPLDKPAPRVGEPAHCRGRHQL